MDNNNNHNKQSKTLGFFKKEGFYVIVFLCICIAATIAAVSVRNSKQAKLLNERNKQITLNTKDTKAEEKKVDYEGALEVKKPMVKEDANKVVNVAKNDVAVKVSTSADAKFAKPVEGVVARVYSEEPVYWSSTTSSRPNYGIDIKANIGKPVFSVADGKVEKIDPKTNASGDGVTITITHQNGLKTVYSNLDEKIAIKLGDVVKKGTQIGNVGKTSWRAAYEEYGDYLHFEILSNNKNVDPAKYVKY